MSTGASALHTPSLLVTRQFQLPCYPNSSSLDGLAALHLYDLGNRVYRFRQPEGGGGRWLANCVAGHFYVDKYNLFSAIAVYFMGVT